MSNNINQLPKLNEDFAWFLGVMCGDGFIGDNRTICLEDTKDKEFINFFSLTCSKLFGLKSHYYKNNTLVIIFSKSLVSLLTKKYGNFKTFTWRVPDELFQSEDKKVIGSFIRGFADSDGSVHPNGSVNLYSSNMNGIKQISTLLKKIGVSHTIYHWFSKNSFTKKEKYCIYISRKSLKRFEKYVDFTIDRKKERLKILTSGKRIKRVSPEMEKEIISLFKKGLKRKDIAQKIGVSPQSIYNHLKKCDFFFSKKWSEKELEILRENYGNLPTKNLKKLLPNHSLHSVHTKITKLRKEGKINVKVRLVRDEKGRFTHIKVFENSG